MSWGPALQGSRLPACLCLHNKWAHSVCHELRLRSASPAESLSKLKCVTFYHAPMQAAAESAAALEAGRSEAEAREAALSARAAERESAMQSLQSEVCHGGIALHMLFLFMTRMPC